MLSPRFACVFTALVLLTSCDREPPWRPIEDLEFSCLPNAAEVYFEGTFNDMPFCYYDGSDGYEMELSVTSSFRTTGPTTSTNPDTSEVSSGRSWVNMGFQPQAMQNSNLSLYIPSLKHKVVIETPLYPLGSEWVQIIKNEITAVGDLPLRNRDEETNGFNITFTYGDRENGVQETFDTASGPRDNGYLTITELRIVKSSIPGESLYEVTFEFAGDLYFRYKPSDYYATLRDCVMRLVFYI